MVSPINFSTGLFFLWIAYGIYLKIFELVRAYTGITEPIQTPKIISTLFFRWNIKHGLYAANYNKYARFHSGFKITIKSHVQNLTNLTQISSDFEFDSDENSEISYITASSSVDKDANIATGVAIQMRNVWTRNKDALLLCLHG